MTEMLHRLILPLVALATLGGAAIGLGRRILPGSDHSLKLIAAPVIGFVGFGITGLMLLLLGLPTWLNLALPVIGVAILVRDRQLVRHAVDQLGAELGQARWAIALAIVAAALLVLPASLGPVVDWDSLAFHDRVAREFLFAGRWFVPPDNLHVAQFGLAHLATFPLRVLGIESAGGALSLAAFVLATVAALLLAVRLGGVAAGWLTVAGFVGAPLLLVVAGTPRVDVVLLAPLMVACLAMGSDSADGTGHRATIAALMLGSAGGVKFHGLAFAVCAAPLVLYACFRTRDRGAWGWLALAVCVPLPMLLLNLLYLGSPVFPFFAPPTVEPWLSTLVGSTVLPSTFDTRFLSSIAGAREPFSLMDFLFDPARLSIEIEGTWYRPSLLLLLLPFALWTKPRRAILALGAPAFAYAAVVLLASSGTNLRYLIPAVGPLLVLAAAGTTSLIGRITRPPIRMVVSCSMMALALAWIPSYWVAWHNPTAIGFLVGRVSATAFKTSHPDPTVRMLVAAEKVDSAIAGRNGKLLLLFEARGEAFSGDVLADTRSVSWPILAQTAGAEDCLVGTGISHVVINQVPLRYYVGRGADPEVLQLEQLDNFVQRCLRAGIAIGPYLVFELAVDTSAGGRGQ